ncbi:hypothetical protein DFH06DRAFT_1233446 [Mycena polygramma]|nr:hypothetical protein DFH06DRAFT_1233446 [Mycena polygramma]
MLPLLSVLRRLPKRAEPIKRWKSSSKKGSVAPIKPRAQDSRQQVEPESPQTTLDRLRATIKEAKSQVRKNPFPVSDFPSISYRRMPPSIRVLKKAPLLGVLQPSGRCALRNDHFVVSYFPSISHCRTTLVTLQPKLLHQGPLASTKDLAVRADGRMYGRTRRRQRTLKLIALLSPPNRIARLKRPTAAGTGKPHNSRFNQPPKILRDEAQRAEVRQFYSLTSTGFILISEKVAIAASRNAVCTKLYIIFGIQDENYSLHVSGEMDHLPMQVSRGQ